jgi:hypothetical protein
MTKHFTQNSSGDDSPDHEDIDKIFSRLDQLNPPADFVNRVKLRVSRLPLPQIREVETELYRDDGEVPIVHHEHKRPS